MTQSQTTQWNRVGSQEINPHIHIQMVFGNDAKNA